MLRVIVFLMAPHTYDSVIGARHISNVDKEIEDIFGRSLQANRSEAVLIGANVH
jgi:hypothetical protein